MKTIIIKSLISIMDVSWLHPVWEENIRILDIKLINLSDFTELILRFGLNTVILYIATYFIYAKKSNRKDFYFSYMAVGSIVFLLTFLLNSVKLEIGFALGLFAIFGIIRYRTDAIPIKEMTYLFTVIGISVVNALANKKVSYAELIFTNTIILAGLYLLERNLLLKQENSVKIIYEKIENIHQLNKEVLLEDLQKRTGIEVSRYEIKEIDFLKDIAEIELFYQAPSNEKK